MALPTGPGKSRRRAATKYLVEEAKRRVAEEMMYYDWDIGWQYDSACRGEDSDLFFAPNYFERKEEKDAREAKAKAICARCPVLDECLDYALRNREPHGIWGGLNEVERKAMIRERERSARRAG